MLFGRDGSVIATLPPESSTAEAVLADFVRLHQQDLLRYARVLGCSDALADDLVQGAFVTTWNKDAIDGEPRREAAFLRKLVRNSWVDENRRQRRRALQFGEAVEELWVEEPDPDTWLEALAACRETLTGRSEAVVAAVYDRGLGRDEAAVQLGMKPNGIKTLLQRTRALLRDCVQQRLQGEK